MTKNIVLAPGVTLRALQTDKFKTACFSVNFLRPHCRQTAALDALLPSVLLRATKNYPDIRSISMHLDELYGTSFGTLVRRKGEVKLTGFFADFIDDAFLPEGEGIFAEVIEFLREVLFRPLTENGCFCTKNVEGEKQNLINAIESDLNDKRAYATLRLLETMCRDEAYGTPRLGYAEDVRAITPQSLWEHYRTVLQTSKIEIFYAGRYAPEYAAEQFAKVFSDDRGDAFTVAQTAVRREAEAVKEVAEAMDVTQGKLVIGLRTGVTVSDPDYPALLLLNAVYGGSVTSKLFTNVREKRSLCYYASSSLDKYKGLMLVSSGIAFENYETTKQAILQELDACRNGEFTDEEIASARKMLIFALRSTTDSPARLDEFYIGSAVSAGDDIPTLIGKLEALTAEDLRRAAQRLSVDTIYFLKGENA
ncbi:MAG: insulinase family protein [Oscillospiraceae bacterium]|nr:insulinase family protein [Oscillospiraceae bacterium]